MVLLVYYFGITSDWQPPPPSHPSIAQVNPIAVNSKYCNVFTENKRVVSIISTVDFGKVCCCLINYNMWIGGTSFQ